MAQDSTPGRTLVSRSGIMQRGLVGDGWRRSKTFPRPARQKSRAAKSKAPKDDQPAPALQGHSQSIWKQDPKPLLPTLPLHPPWKSRSSESAWDRGLQEMQLLTSQSWAPLYSWW
jgi:hypothetical protein